ncbi:MAG TPA: hypothetical protein P5305_01310 [Rubrivivax sp.]|nr:hypothetical protein [Rubrivivax sp.]HRY86490.1 hypothetical protein [Rubrivivax sp.]
MSAPPPQASPTFLPGSLRRGAQLDCSQCGGRSDAHSGVQVSATRWRCGACWRRPLLATQKKSPPSSRG